MDLGDLDAAAVTFTAHKVHGPVGVGALWLNSAVKVQPIFRGGQQQLDSRPGTEPVALIVGMAEAIRLASVELTENGAQMSHLRDHLESSLLARHENLVSIGQNRPRIPSTCCIAMVGTDRQSMLMALDLAGVACSSGAACSSGSSPPSHVLEAMSVPPSWLNSALRFGTSKFSTAEDIDTAIDRISLAYNRLRQL